MAPGTFLRWSLRWAPEMASVGTAVAVVVSLAYLLVWRLAQPAVISSWIIAGVLAFGAVGLLLDRRARPTRATATLG
jgi:hypothetical protein